MHPWKPRWGSLPGATDAAIPNLSGDIGIVQLTLLATRSVLIAFLSSDPVQGKAQHVVSGEIHNKLRGVSRSTCSNPCELRTEFKLKVTHRGLCGVLGGTY